MLKIGLTWNKTQFEKAVHLYKHPIRCQNLNWQLLQVKSLHDHPRINQQYNSTKGAKKKERKSCVQDSIHIHHINNTSKAKALMPFI